MMAQQNVQMCGRKKKYWQWPVVPLSLLPDAPVVWISKSYVTLFSSYHIYISENLSSDLEVKITEI